jgi:SAM-dependent methyltransferase
VFEKNASNMLVQETEWYKDWFNSPYYHLLYEDRNENEAAAFIDRLIEALKPKNDAVMLDIACGKGRHSIQLANKGYFVSGIDISPKSIAEALRSASANLEFFEHDMRFPFRTNYYDYGFNFFTSFGYFDTYREHLNTIHNMALALKKNGILVIDYLNPEYILRNLSPYNEINKGDVRFIIERKAEENYFLKKITTHTPKLKEPLIYTEKVANFSLDDFTSMFQANGLTINQVFGDYELNSFQPSVSPRMIMIARKQ